MYVVVVCSECPAISMTGESDYECTENCPDDDVMVLTQPATSEFKCTYELTGKTTVYSWYLDGVVQSGYTASSASIDIPAGDHRVECRANIVMDAGCECNDITVIDIVVLGKQYA